MPEPITIAQVKQLLTEEAALRTLPREATLAQAHAEMFARLTPEQAEKLVSALQELPSIDRSLAVKIADILPQYPEEIRLVMAKERAGFDEAAVTRVLEVVAQHR
ncbi:MAG: RNA polymerase Rpb4 family protein [Thermoplasmata archaeon]|jgi:DNA-directed RNA polymerase subunit F